MPRTPRTTSRVRFSLPLNRQNTVYRDTSHIPHLTEEQIDISDEETVAQWLFTDGTPPSAPYRKHASEFDDPNRASSSLSGTPGPLVFQLLHSGLERSGNLPPDDVPPPAPRAKPQPVPKLKKTRRSDFTQADGTPLSYHYSNAFFNNDEQLYTIPSSRPLPSSNEDQPEIQISVTKDCSRRKLLKHPDDQLLIYRVPADRQLQFGFNSSECGLNTIAVRRPEDGFDPIRVTRHGHVSWDVGDRDEAWYLVSKDLNLMMYVSNRVAETKPSLLTTMKRSFWKNFGFRKSHIAILS